MTPPRDRINTPGQIAVLEERDKHFEKRLDGLQNGLGEVRGAVTKLSDAVGAQNKELAALAGKFDAVLEARKSLEQAQAAPPMLSRKTIGWMASIFTAIILAIMQVWGGGSSAEEPKAPKPIPAETSSQAESAP